jgi:uncharacterized protein YndB with AHSA1/START domain
MTHPQQGATSYEIIHRYPVPLKRVWRAWTEPESLATWAWGRNAKGVEVEIDLRVGGLYTLYTEPQDETSKDADGWGVCGLYVEVEPLEQLTYTQHWTASVGYNEDQDVVDELVMVGFREIDGQTEVRYQHLGIPNDKSSVEAHSSAVRSTLDDLAALFSEGVL